MYQSQVSNARRDMERFREKQSTEEQRAAKLHEEARRLRERAAGTGSANMAKSYLGQAGTKERDANKASRKAAEHSGEVAKNQIKLHKAEHKLEEARDAEARRANQKETQARKLREQEQQRERQRKERDDRQRTALADRQTANQRHEITRLSVESAGLRRDLEAVSRRLAPSNITVLFWASSPEDQARLRLDKEAREIELRVRLSEHRDAIRFEHKAARQLVDLIQDLNETKPNIVHFSGHGSETGLAFEDDEGAYKPLANSQLAALLNATSDRIRLVVFNSCESAAQAELATDSVDLAIGMSATIEDGRAKTFAAQLYGSLGFGKSVQAAFDQATAAITVEHGDGGEIPQLFAAEGIDPSTTILVSPESD